ncbi:MAG: class I SAM-dependent methyltransferase [Myxococcota bacterium]
MSDRVSSLAWSGERGEHWRANLDGLEAMLEPVDEALITALDLPDATRIGDIGCGSGATTLALRHRAEPEAIVHGYDVSPVLLDVARHRAPDLALEFMEADVGIHPVPSLPYDRLTSRFGVMFFEEPRVAFGRLLHWLGEGGRFVFAVWGTPTDNAWATTVRNVVAQLVELPAPPADAPGPLRYGEPTELVTLLTEVGFADVAVESWTGRLPIGLDTTAEGAARFALGAFSTFGRVLAEAGEATRTEAERRLTEAFASHVVPSQGVRMSARVHLVSGGRR